MVVIRSYGGRAANIHRDNVTSHCPFMLSACHACNSLTCFGVWILMALVGGGLTVWGSIQIADHGGDLSAHVAAVCCGLALMAISIGLAGRACKIEHKRRRTEHFDAEAQKTTTSPVSAVTA